MNESAIGEPHRKTNAMPGRQFHCDCSRIRAAALRSDPAGAALR